MLKQAKPIFGVPVAEAKPSRFVIAHIKVQSLCHRNMWPQNPNVCFSADVKKARKPLYVMVATTGHNCFGLVYVFRIY